MVPDRLPCPAELLGVSYLTLSVLTALFSLIEPQRQSNTHFPGHIQLVSFFTRKRLIPQKPVTAAPISPATIVSDILILILVDLNYKI